MSTFIDLSEKRDRYQQHGTEPWAVPTVANAAHAKLPRSEADVAHLRSMLLEVAKLSHEEGHQPSRQATPNDTFQGLVAASSGYFCSYSANFSYSIN